MTINETLEITHRGRPYRRYRTLAEIIKLFEREGLDIIDYAEADRGHKPYTTHSIEFEGGYHDAMRAALIAANHSLHISSLHQNWKFTDNVVSKPTWQIMIFASRAAE